MKIVVIGGSGLIGSKLVTKLREQGHEAVAASPNSGVNSITGEGLAEALKGASVVVDVTNSPSWEDAAVMKFFETSTRNLLSYGAAAGVKHHLALSVVGTERLLASGFFRAKMAQENLIKASSNPYTIIRATQFFEFVKGITDFSTEGNKVRLPTALIQPMAADDVAGGVGRIATGSPVNGTVEIGGPEKFRLDELVRQYLAANKDPREVVADPKARYYGVEISERHPPSRRWRATQRDPFRNLAHSARGESGGGRPLMDPSKRGRFARTGLTQTKELALMLVLSVRCRSHGGSWATLKQPGKCQNQLAIW